MAARNNWFEHDKSLTRRFAIYLPGKDKSGKSIHGLDVAVDATMTLLCNAFGGVTSFPAAGRFQRESGGTQSEDILVLESFCETQAWVDHSEYLHAWAGILAAVLVQESIACLLDGKMILVPPSPLKEPLHHVTPASLQKLAATSLGSSVP